MTTKTQDGTKRLPHAVDLPSHSAAALVEGWPPPTPGTLAALAALIQSAAPAVAA
jgi:hypothetical protein